MAAPTDVYVNPAIAANSGTGTSGDPYGDLQYALNTVTRDATNGNRFLIKAGTAEVATAQLSLATYGVPTADAPVIFEGYTATAGDGGQGEVSGGAGNFTLLPATQFQFWRNCKIGNTGSAAILNWASVNWNVLDSCELHTSTAGTPISLGSGCRIVHCNIHSFTTASQNALILSGACDVIGNYFSVTDIAHALSVNIADGCTISGNIFNTGNANGIRINSVRGHICTHNSILSSAGTGAGILLDSTGADGLVCHSNIISGYSGAGGCGVKVVAGSRFGTYGYNYIHNCETAESGVSGAVLVSLGSVTTGATDPYAKSGSNTFANRFTYFAPVSDSTVRAAYPSATTRAKGAVQPSAGSSGGLLLPRSMNGGFGD